MNQFPHHTFLLPKNIPLPKRKLAWSSVLEMVGKINEHIEKLSQGEIVSELNMMTERIYIARMLNTLKLLSIPVHQKQDGTFYVVRKECWEALFPLSWEEKVDELNDFINKMKTIKDKDEQEYAILVMRAMIRALEEVGAVLVPLDPEESNDIHYVLDETA